MRRMITTLIFVLGLLMAPTTSFAGDISYNGTDQALMGLNGVVTAPADVVMGVVQGDDRFDLPGNFGPVEFVNDRAVGLFTGAFTLVHRLTFGLADMPLAPMPFVHVSPDPRFIVVPGAPTITVSPPGFPQSP